MSSTPLLLLRVTTLPFETLDPLGGTLSGKLLDELVASERAIADDGQRLARRLHDAAGGPQAATSPEAARTRVAILRLRRDVHNRRPSKPGDLAAAAEGLEPALHRALEHYGEAVRAHEVGEHACREAIARDLVQARHELLQLASHPRIEEAVWLASRSLAARVERLSGRDPAGFGHDARHVAGKLLAYVVRICTKTSPNGLFCATALARFGDGLPVLSGSSDLGRADVILNVVEARKVAACLAVDPALDGATVPRPNPTLREDAEGWTFWKPASMRHEDEEEVRSRVKAHPVARIFLEEARNGKDVPSLIAAVGARCEIEPEALTPFYRTLVERGLLLGEVELPYNTRRPLRRLADAARTAGCAPSWLGRVEEVEQLIDGLEGLSVAGRIAILTRATGILEELVHVRPLKPDEMFRVDVASRLDVGLPSRILGQLRAGLRTYVRMFSAFYPERLHRSAQAARFLRAFPPDTEVSLLDLYHGVFEPEDKRRPVAFPDPARVAAEGVGADAASSALALARDHFARRAREARAGEEIEVTEAEVAALVGDSPEPRWSCGVLFQVEASGADALTRGEYRLVLSALFQGTGLALARFAHLHGEAVVRELREGWSCLARPGAVLAELTYNHSYRTANAGLRPAIFEHEIELPGDRGRPGARVIPLAALTVRWDSARHRFVLTWPETGLEVLPVINSGVNPVGIISFLVDIGQQGLQPLGLFPGFSAEGVRHWPRFVSGRLVLFRERWLFAAGEWPAASPREEDAVLQAGLWRRQHALPRHVFVHTSSDPKPRYVDLDSPLMVALLLRQLAAENPAELHLTEMLPGPDGLWVRDTRGRYASEFLVHLGTDRAPGGDA